MLASPSRHRVAACGALRRVTGAARTPGFFPDSCSVTRCARQRRIDRRDHGVVDFALCRVPTIARPPDREPRPGAAAPIATVRVAARGPRAIGGQRCVLGSVGFPARGASRALRRARGRLFATADARLRVFDSARISTYRLSVDTAASRSAAVFGGDARAPATASRRKARRRLILLIL